MALDVKIQQKIQAYRQSNPKVKMSDEQIVSILVKNGEIVLSEDQKRSLFANNSKHNDNIGLKLEKTAKKPNPEKTIYLQSGRKIVYSKLSNGKTVMKYYGADGNRINPDYFKKVEGQISISADGNSYTVTKNGKKQTLKAKNPTQGAIDQNIAKLNNQEKALNKAKKEQGWIGKGWDWLKNTTGFWAGSDKAQQQINAEKKLLNQIKTGKVSKKDFKEVTGLDYTKENLAKFQKGELSQAEEKINGYKEGQDMATDMVGDMVSGIGAVGIYTVAVAAAPVTGGASLWVGFGLATASGAAIKVGVKALDTVGTDKKYTLKDLKHDAATGAFSGGLAPVTAGLGGAVGKTVATKFGVQAIKTVGKEVAEETAKGGVKSTLKAALANPAGYEYVGGTFAKRTTSMAAEMATDGALGGAIDGGFRAGLDSDWDAETMLDGAIEGGVGGALFAPVIGGGMKGVGIAFNRIKGVDEFSSLVSNCDKLADDDLKELYKYYKTLEIESNYKGKEIPDIKKSSFEKLMQEIETRKINVDDIEIKNRYLLEGDVSPDDLNEVAPFAQHLTEEKHIGDIVVPNKENVEIVNGDFVNGEFVPDGSVTFYAHGNNPLNKKSFTLQRTSYPSFLVAQNKKELTQQILDILGNKKINKYKIKEIDEILQKNPELKISDLSEILGYLNNIGHARHFIQQGLSSVKDFKSFKANVKNYGEFLYQLEHANHGYQIRDISGAKFEDYHFNDFMNFIESIDSESFEANCNAFLNMRGYFKNYLHPKDFLSTVHDKKCLERIQILDDFNYEYTDWSRTSRYNKVEPFCNLDVLSDDKKFAELLERMEYCKRATLYSQPDANRILHWGDNFESFKKFDSSIPENLKYDIYKFYNEIFANCPDNIDKFIEFCNKMPEDWFKSYFKKETHGYTYREEICNLFMNFGAECYDEKWYKTVENGYWVHKEFQPKDRTPEELLKRIDLLNKVEHLLKYKYGKEEHIDVHVIDRILTVYDIKDIDKAMLFLNTADENYLRLIKLDNYHSGDSNTNYDLFKLINSENLDNMIENARVYNELSVDIQELFAKKAGWNFDIKFDIPTEDFKARIDIIKKYGEILDDDNLIKIFKGESNNIKAFERFAQLQKELKEQVQSVYSNYNIECLGILNDTGYQKFVSLVSEIKFKPDEFRNVLWNLNNNKILFEELSLDELKLIPHRIFEDNCYWLKIGKFRQRISQIPEKLRPYFKESNELLVSYSTLFDSVEEYGIKSRDMMLKLGKFNKDDLDILGSNTIQTIINEATYKDIELNILLQKIEEFKKIPKEGLELLKTNGRNMYDLLMSDNIDTKTITERFNLLIQRNLNSVIDSDNFYTLIRAGEEKYSIVKTLLENPNREIKDINSLIRSLPSSATVKKHHDYIFNNLINNPKNRTEDIPAQLNYIFRHEYFSFKEGSERLLKYDNQREFSKKVINDLIKRDIHNDTSARTYTLSSFLSTIIEFDLDELDIEKTKYESLKKFMSSQKYDQNDVINLYGRVERKYYKEHIKLIEKMLNDEKFSYRTIDTLNHAIVYDAPESRIKILRGILNEGSMPEEDITPIIKNVTDINATLAELLCTNKELDFPIDKIAFLLQCNISSEISPRVVAEKTKKFFDLGLDDDFIKDILENSESLTFYSDEVLKILKQRSIDDPKTPLKDVLKALVGNTPDKLQDRIDTLILLAKFTDEEVAIFKKQGVDVNYKMEQLENLINAKHDLISTTQSDINTFLKSIANTQAADDVIRNADFEQFGEKGIQLQYSREEFIKRMNELSGGDFSRAIQRAEDVEIPTLKMSQDDIVKSKEVLEKYKNQYMNNTKEYNVIIDGKETKVTRFCGSQTGGSNEGDFAQIGDKLYYIKFPDETKLEQSIQEVMASELYRAAGIDAPNMKVMFDKDGKILGMASEYIPNVGEAANGKNLFDSFVADAWLADWDAPKHGNSVMRNGSCLKMDVGGSMDYRARGTKKDDFGNIVNELTSLIEQNGDYYSMTKGDVISSLKHVTNVSDEQVWKIIENVPAEYRNYTLGQKMLTRRDFIKKFETIFEQMDETKYNNILDMINDAKLQTIREFDGGTNVASLLGYEQTALGFEGLLNTRDLSGLKLKPQELATAQKMIHEIENFTKFNRVADNVPLPNEAKNFLNSILKGIPEFAAYFSKQQHNGTKYSLDVHILKVLQDSLKDPDYAKLSDQDKFVLKFSTLLHDIGKRYLGSNSDTGHASLSAEYVYSILDRFKLSDDMKDRIISIVENHHWFKDFNNGVMDERTIATIARRPQDWLIYKIMAKADLVNVSEDFAIKHVKDATTINDLSQAFDKQVATIEERIKELREKQVVVTSTQWVDVPERVKSNGDILEARTFGRKTAEIDGVDTEFKVLNLNEIADDEDMFKYGFNHLKRKDLRFIIHMPGDGSIKWFNVFKTLSQNPLNNSAQSLSMISVDDTSTYCGRMFGFILDVNNANISHAYYSNTGSGTGKGLQNFVHELFEDGHHRSYVKDQFIDFLKTERGIEIDDSAYAKITEYIMSKKFPETQLKGNFTIDGKTYKANDILDAFTFSRDQLIKETKEKTHGSHNEMVGLNAKVKGLIAKVNTFEELPEYFLRFAKENNLPIILIGNQ